jgi:prepilin-type N-terminal cleavage/methylation domain-containing protein
MKTSSGFTIIELLVTLVLVGILGGIAYDQGQSLRMVHRDQDRKIAINAIYYNLQEVAKPKLGGYPRVLKASDLRAMDPALLKDPHGVMIGNAKSDYRYEPTGCNGGDICSGFTLRADLERESDFVKSSFSS